MSFPLHIIGHILISLPYLIPAVGSAYSSRLSEHLIHISGLLIVPVCLLIADFVAIVATWMKTYHHVRQAASLGIPTVAKILLRDGAFFSTKPPYNMFILWIRKPIFSVRYTLCVECFKTLTGNVACSAIFVLTGVQSLGIILVGYLLFLSSKEAVEHSFST